jgi:uncharacterized protein
MRDLLAVSKLIDENLLAILQGTYRMDWDGIHGFAHWCRVRENGLRLAELNGANPKVIEYFAFFHDNQRFNDHHDPYHGSRASALIRKQFANRLDLNLEEINLLCDACEAHTKGLTIGPLTVQTCWDADRLDLGRVGKYPDKNRMCTEAAKKEEIINWAVERSRVV